MKMQPDGSLRIGAAEIDITPPLGTHMGGDACRLRPVEKVLDPLWARALIVEHDHDGTTTRLCVLSLDLCTPGDEISDILRDRLGGRLGVKREAVMLHLLQNHSAPSIGGHLLLRHDSPHVDESFWWVYQGDANYVDFLVPKLDEVVDAAAGRLEPVAMTIGGVADGRVAHNRRYVMRDGWVQTQPEDRTQMLHPEGPADPEVGATVFRNAADRPVAALLHHTAHPVSYFNEHWVTASWPGAWARQFREAIDEECIPLVINGCCGNINTYSAMDPSPRMDDDAIGAVLTEMALVALETGTHHAGGAASVADRILPLPYCPIVEHVGEEALATARALIAREPEPRWRPGGEGNALDIEWLFALMLTYIEHRTASGTYDYEVQAFRIGPLGLVGLTGEPFSEGQLALKGRAPCERTFVAHMCNGYVGYIPPEAGHRAQNFNFRTPEGVPVRRGANLFLLEANALDRIVDTSVELLTKLFD